MRLQPMDRLGMMSIMVNSGRRRNSGRACLPWPLRSCRRARRELQPQLSTNTGAFSSALATACSSMSSAGASDTGAESLLRVDASVTSLLSAPTDKGSLVLVGASAAAFCSGCRTIAIGSLSPFPAWRSSFSSTCCCSWSCSSRCGVCCVWTDVTGS